MAFSAGPYFGAFAINSPIELTDQQIEDVHDVLKGAVNDSLDPQDRPAITAYVYRYVRTEVTF
jgi:hypothetical protein